MNLPAFVEGGSLISRLILGNIWRTAIFIPFVNTTSGTTMGFAGYRAQKQSHETGIGVYLFNNRGQVVLGRGSFHLAWTGVLRDRPYPGPWINTNFLLRLTIKVSHCLQSKFGVSSATAIRIYNLDVIIVQSFRVGIFVYRAVLRVEKSLSLLPRAPDRQITSRIIIYINHQLSGNYDRRTEPSQKIISISLY